MFTLTKLCDHSKSHVLLQSFVPPRMNKMPRQDLDESSQLSQNIELEIDSQIGQTFSQYSRSNLIHSDKLEILNSRGYQRQHQGNFSSLSMYQGGQKKDDDSMDTNLQNPNESNLIGRNLNSMASPIADYMNQLKKVCFDSQDSNGSNRIKSPWSVYGSNNNSPKTLNSPRNEGIGRTDLKAVVTEPDNGAEHSVNNSDQLKCRSTQEQTLQDLDSFHNDKLEEGKADKYDCVTESNNEDFSELTDRHHKVVNENTKNEFQSKRSMLEIMKLVKGKTALFGTNRKESDNKMQEKSRALRCNERVLNEEQIDSNSVDHENENVIETNNLRIDSYKINDKSELLSNTPHSSTHEEVTAIDLDSCELSPTERLDMDVCPSFAISFSPLSNVTYSDDESVQEDKIASKCVIDNTATVKSVDTSEVNEVSNSTVSNHVKWLMPDALHQRVKQNKSDIDSHTNFPNDNIVNEDENAFKNENDSLTLSAQCDKITPEDRKESPGNDNHVHSSSGEGDGLLSKKEINDTPKEFSDPTNDQEEKSSYEAEDIVQNRIQGKCSVQVDRNNKKENSDTETIGQDESNENIGQCLDGISSVKNADETMTQFVGSINGTVETAENLKESLFENEIPKSDITEESDFIDLIDNAECNNALETEIFDCNSVVSDKTVSGVSDRKTTQSQDTMEYSCDTMSHCSDSQLFLQSQPLEVPDIAKFKSLDKSNIILPIQQTRKSEEFKSSFESQEVSQQIPLGSTYIGLGQKLQSQNVSPSLSKGAYVKDNIEKYPIIQCDRDCVKPKLRHNKELPHDRDSEPLKSHDLSSEENIQRPHFIDCDPHQEAEPECESILTQIDNHHTVNMYERSANSGHQRVKRWKNLGNSCNEPVICNHCSYGPGIARLMYCTLFRHNLRNTVEQCAFDVIPITIQDISKLPAGI